MTHTVSRRPLATDNGFSPCAFGICGGQSGTGTDISLRVLLFFPVIIIPSLLHVRSVIYHRRRILWEFYSVFK